MLLLKDNKVRNEQKWNKMKKEMKKDLACLEVNVYTVSIDAVYAA